MNQIVPLWHSSLLLCLEDYTPCISKASATLTQEFTWLKKLLLLLVEAPSAYTYIDPTYHQTDFTVSEKNSYCSILPKHTDTQQHNAY